MNTNTDKALHKIANELTLLKVFFTACRESQSDTEKAALLKKGQSSCEKSILKIEHLLKKITGDARKK